MVSDIMPTVADLTVPDILLSRNDSVLELDTTVMFDTTTARPIQLQDLYDSESLLRYFTKWIKDKSKLQSQRIVSEKPYINQFKYNISW